MWAEGGNEAVIPPPKVEFSRALSRRGSMKTSRFTDSRIIAVLEQAETGTPAPELVASTESVRQLFTSGAASLAAWTHH